MKNTTTKPWQLASWRKRRKELLKDECEICGQKGVLVLHHKHHRKSKTPEEFARYCMPEPEDVITVCKRCHMRLERGLVLCSKCGKNWHKAKYRTCFECLPERVKQEAQEYNRFEAEMRAIEMLIEKACEEKYRGESHVYIEYESETGGGQMTLPESLVDEAKAVLGDDIYIDWVKEGA